MNIKYPFGRILSSNWERIAEINRRMYRDLEEKEEYTNKPKVDEVCPMFTKIS